MILKISCPACDKAYRLTAPYPPPGKRYRCTCGRVITVTYPPELTRMLETGVVTAEASLPETALPGTGPSSALLTADLEAPEEAAISPSPEPAAHIAAGGASSPERAPGPFSATKLPPTNETRPVVSGSNISGSNISGSNFLSPQAPAPEPTPRAIRTTGPGVRVAVRRRDDEDDADGEEATPTSRTDSRTSPRIDEVPATVLQGALLTRSYEQKPVAPIPIARMEKPRGERQAAPPGVDPGDLGAILPEKPRGERQAAPPIGPGPEPRGELEAARQSLASSPADGGRQPEAPLALQPEATSSAPLRAPSPVESPAPVEPAAAPVAATSGFDEAPIPPGPPSTPPDAAADGERPPRRRWPYALAALLLLAVLGAAGAAGTIWYYSRDLPSLEALKTYNPPTPSRVYARGGQLIGEFYGEERRYVLPFDQIPKRVVQAYIAAEDSSFFQHHGIDYFGIARAMLTNLREQRMAQGASTITQQVARSFLLTREKKLERKIVEALLAYRIENTFPKDHILYLYLNQIYLGEGAYGVQAAARTYFGKDVKDLSLAETALLAGLPPAPSRYSPLDHYKEAKERQRYVLKSMVRDQYITEEEAAAAEKESLDLKPRSDFNKTVAPFVAEHVRRYLVAKYGDDKVLKEGLEVHTTIDYDLQQAAQEAVKTGVREIDHRIGFRGPLQHLEPADIPAFSQKYEESLKNQMQMARPGGIARFGAPPAGPPQLEVGQVYQGVATEVKDEYAVVRIGSQEGVLPLEQMKWAYSVNPQRNWHYRELDRITRVLNPGDVIEVRLLSLTWPDARRSELKSKLELALEQEPELEGSLFSYSPEDGSVIAMVGGYDFNRSEFNRPFQAKRQFGSAFKPLVYAAALDDPDKVYTPTTILLDAPITMHKEGDSGTDKDDKEPDPTNSDLWKPSNYDRDYLGEITLRKALYLSRNTVAVKVLTDIGVSYAYDYVTKLGIESPLNKDTSMVLGTSSVTLVEMCRAYSAFADAGSIVEPVFIDKVLDRTGKILEQRVDPPVKKQVMPASTAYIMTSMLQDVVRQGTATRALVLGKPVAGKTGTTNEFLDASFIGYTPQLVTGSWIGYDQPKTMGFGQTGGDTALPMWVEYMKAALKVYPKTEYKVPEDVVFAVVDEATGKLANEDTKRKIRVPFQKGKEPTDAALAPGQVGTEDFLSVDQGQ